jgi:hypothetical protein
VQITPRSLTMETALVVRRRPSPVALIDGTTTELCELREPRALPRPGGVPPEDTGFRARTDPRPRSRRRTPAIHPSFKRRLQASLGILLDISV